MNSSVDPMSQIHIPYLQLLDVVSELLKTLKMLMPTASDFYVALLTIWNSRQSSKKRSSVEIRGFVSTLGIWGDGR